MTKRKFFVIWDPCDPCQVTQRTVIRARCAEEAKDRFLDECMLEGYDAQVLRVEECRS